MDEKNRLNLFDGQIRVVDPAGGEFTRYQASDYLDHISEHVEPWTYMKFPFLKEIGWKGFQDEHVPPGPFRGITSLINKYLRKSRLSYNERRR